MKFSELDLAPEILQGIEQAGYQDCTPIQEQVIPPILQGKDVSGLAQTGTGKTAAFLVPLLDRWIRAKKGETGDRVASEWTANSYFLILVPTRELAAQVDEQVKKLAGATGATAITIVGGASYDDQKKGIRSGATFIVGTPGRLLDLYKSHELDLRGVNAVVFDEADRMFDMGFKDDMKFLLRRIPQRRQFLLFSATLNFEVLNTAYQFGAEPIEFNVSRDQATAEGVEHEILHVGLDEKPKFLLSILKKINPSQCIVFSNYKQNVARIALFLKKNGIEAVEMSSLLTQHQRNKVIEQFKSGQKKVLVATDVAARGLDIKGVDLVINYELPDDPEGYVHRIGRTGRAGAKGKAYGFCSGHDVEALQRVEAYLKEKMTIGWMDDSELVKEFEPFPNDRETERSFGSGAGREPLRGGAGGGRGGDRGSRGPGGGGGQGGGRGPRPQGSQGPRQHEPRQQRAPQQRDPQGSQAADSGGGLPSALTGTHRDRKTGRHGSGADGHDWVAAKADPSARVSAPEDSPLRNQGGGHRNPRGGHQGGRSSGGHAAGGKSRHPSGGGHSGNRNASGGGRSHSSGPHKSHGAGKSGHKVVQHTHRRPLKKSGSIGAKIKGFFKGIFGSSK